MPLPRAKLAKNFPSKGGDGYLLAF